MQHTIKDKIFIAIIVIIAFVAGAMLMLAISEFEQQEDIQSVEFSVSKTKANK